MSDSHNKGLGFFVPGPNSMSGVPDSYGPLSMSKTGQEQGHNKGDIIDNSNNTYIMSSQKPGSGIGPLLYGKPLYSGLVEFDQEAKLINQNHYNRENQYDSNTNQDYRGVPTTVTSGSVQQQLPQNDINNHNPGLYDLNSRLRNELSHLDTHTIDDLEGFLIDLKQRALENKAQARVSADSGPPGLGQYEASNIESINLNNNTNLNFNSNTVHGPGPGPKSSIETATQYDQKFQHRTSNSPRGERMDDRRPDYSSTDRRPDYSNHDYDRRPEYSSTDRRPDYSRIDRRPDYSNHDYDRRPEYSSTDRRPDYSSIDRRPDYSSTDRRPDYSSTDRRPDYSSTDRRPDYSSTDRRPDYSSTDRRPDYSSTDRRPDYSSTDRRPDYSSIDRRPDLYDQHRDLDYNRSRVPDPGPVRGYYHYDRDYRDRGPGKGYSDYDRDYRDRGPGNGYYSDYDRYYRDYDYPYPAKDYPGPLDNGYHPRYESTGKGYQINHDFDIWHGNRFHELYLNHNTGKQNDSNRNHHAGTTNSQYYRSSTRSSFMPEGLVHLDPMKYRSKADFLVACTYKVWNETVASKISTDNPDQILIEELQDDNVQKAQGVQYQAQNSKGTTTNSGGMSVTQSRSESTVQTSNSGPENQINLPQPIIATNVTNIKYPPNINNETEIESDSNSNFQPSNLRHNFDEILFDQIIKPGLSIPPNGIIHLAEINNLLPAPVEPLVNFEIRRQSIRSSQSSSQDGGSGTDNVNEFDPWSMLTKYQKHRLGLCSPCNFNIKKHGCERGESNCKYCHYCSHRRTYVVDRWMKKKSPFIPRGVGFWDYDQCPCQEAIESLYDVFLFKRRLINNVRFFPKAAIQMWTKNRTGPGPGGRRGIQNLELGLRRWRELNSDDERLLQSKKLKEDKNEKFKDLSSTMNKTQSLSIKNSISTLTDGSIITNKSSFESVV